MKHMLPKLWAVSPNLDKARMTNPSVISQTPPLRERSASDIQWPLLGRIGFRFGFCYLALSVLTVTNIVALLPLIGNTLQSWIDLFWEQPAQWLAQHLFHMTGVAALRHAADSRDTALDWITLGLILLAAAVATAIWSVLDRRRPHYQTAAAWLRFFTRLALIFLLFRYGLMKIYPLQMPPPSLAVLNEPLGNTSPLTLLWTLLGMHPAYEMICGAIETTAAVLLIFRRTALPGALLAAFVMTNVLLFNLFFDVPVKLGAANLLLYSLAVIVPDLPALFDFFWRGRATAPHGIWVPPLLSRRFRFGLRAAEIVFLVLALLHFLPMSSQQAAQQRASVRHPSPLAGVWHVDSAILTKQGKSVSIPVLTGEGLPMTALSLEPAGNAFARAQDGRLWRVVVIANMAKHTLTFIAGSFDGDHFDATYSVVQPNAQHMVLTPIGADAATHATLILTRIPLPADYPLLDRSFHWVSEWGYWR